MSIDPFSSPTEAPGAPDELRLRAGLRLFLPGDRADDAVRQILESREPWDSVSTVAHELDRERQVARVVNWMLRRNGSGASRRRADQSGDIRPSDMIALLLHVGLGQTGDQIEDVFGHDRQDVGPGLLQARLAFVEHPIAPCREYAWLIGWYRDQTLTPEDRLELLTHSSSCDACRHALEQAQQADATMLARIESNLTALPKGSVIDSAGRTRRRSGTVTLVAGSVMLAVILLLGIAAFDRITAGERAPVPLFAGVAPDQTALDGWLLQVSPVGYLEGVNLADGHKRGLDSGDGGNFSPFYRVSRTHIASWRPSDGQRDDVLTIGPIGEQVKFRLTWNRQFVYWYPSGWLGDDTLLIVKSPEHIPGETERSYLDRLTRESRLIAFDANTGDERVLMTGNVAAAYPSPDGTMVAILHPIDRRWPGNTLELRPFDGESVGESVATIENRIVSDGVWLADSSRFITSVIADPSVTIQEWQRTNDLEERGVDTVNMEAIAHDGSRTVLASTTTPTTVLPIVSSPDGQTLVYQERTMREESLLITIPEYDWNCYRLSLAGGERELLTSGGSPERIFNPTWSPDGSILVVPVARTFPLADSDEILQPNNPNASILLLFDADWRPGMDPRTIYSSGRDLYGWLEPGSLEPRRGQVSEERRSLASVELDREELDQLSLGARSVVDGDGSYVVVEARGSRLPLIWDIVAHRSRRIQPSTTDLAWFNQGQTTIGVVRQNSTGGSRIVLNAADISSSAAYLDRSTFDPAGIGDSTDRQYARPLVSPSGSLVSFFVVDEPMGHVSLWIDHQSGPATVVAEWTLPPNRVTEPPTLALWASADTLLFAKPDDWIDGAPTVASISRLIVGPSGHVEIDELVRLGLARGSAGVVLNEMTLSPDATHLAYRLRHFDQATTTSSSSDSLHIAATSDLGRAVEIERGGRGDGLLWTRLGERVIAEMRGRIVLYSADGRDIEYLSPRGTRASSPVVIGDQVWFEAVDDWGGSIWHVTLE